MLNRGGWTSAFIALLFVGIMPPAVQADTAFVPDDPYFHKETPGGWTGPGQWHLLNEYGTGIDVNVWPVWQRGITGAGVIIGIVDEGVEWPHPDLLGNYSQADSWDFKDNDSDPSPASSDENHGTAVAGLAAAVGGNGVGVTGTAPGAQFASLRRNLADPNSVVAAILYHNSNIKIKNHSYGSSALYVAGPSIVSALAVSAATGTINIFAAGNERGASSPYTPENPNKMAAQSSPDAITVAALGGNGKFASYGNYGACIMVCAPSSTDSSGGYYITTVDCAGNYGYNASGTGESRPDAFPDANYTSMFGGTSAAAPIVSGVLALVKQVQPNLDTRMAKHLLAMTSRILDANDNDPHSDGGWRTNAAGRHFNQNYGFGLIDAGAMCAEAVKYSGVTALQTETTGRRSNNGAGWNVPYTAYLPTYPGPLPDGDANHWLTLPFTVSSTTPLEEVMVNLEVAPRDPNATNYSESGWRAYITSPSGYRSLLFCAEAWGSYGAGTGFANWTYTSNAFWGEDPNGAWKLELSQGGTFASTHLNAYTVTMRMGELVSVPEPASAILLAAGLCGMLCRRRKRGDAGQQEHGA